MSDRIHKFFCIIDGICEKSGRAVCLLICIIMVTTTVEVVARYVFNHPTVWVWPTNRQLFGIFILFAGIYTMYKDSHIRVEILHDRFPPKLKKIARWVAIVSFLIFMVALILQGARMGWNSLRAGETATGAFPIPLFPLKLLIPLTAALFLLEGLAGFFQRNRTDQ
jgi:TRAP-type mannitol/chloroaromatic compound transport system permease small subunit